jgi:phage shock protein PspC (stress-responsive transcriptional regulator)
MISLYNFQWRGRLAQETFLEWTDNTTFHGIGNVFRSKFTVFRIMWITVFLLSVAMFAVMIYKTTANYLSFEVVTKLFTVEETNMIFPQVTFF